MATLYADAARRINEDRDVRCAILTGAGSAFSAGGNLKAMRERSGGFSGGGVHIRERYRNGIHRIIRALWGIEVPLLAAVNGPAIGLGNDVACLADIRIAADNAIFGATFLRVGLVPGDGGAWILPRVIGQSRAAELFFTADTIDAQTALAWGLVSKLVPADKLMDEARALAARICRQPPDVLRMTKKLMREGQTTGFRVDHGAFRVHAVAGAPDGRSPRSDRGLFRKAPPAIQRRVAAARYATTGLSCRRSKMCWPCSVPRLKCLAPVKSAILDQYSATVVGGGAVAEIDAVGLHDLRRREDAGRRGEDHAGRRVLARQKDHGGRDVFGLQHFQHLPAASGSRSCGWRPPGRWR